MLSAFRKSIRDKWKDRYGKTPKDWCPDSMRLKTRSFFVEMGISEAEYDAHEPVFFMLLHHAKKDLAVYDIKPDCH